MSDSSNTLRNPLEWTSLGLKACGVILLLAYLLGAFENQDRVTVHETLRDGSNVDAGSQAAQDLLSHFGAIKLPVPAGAVLRRKEPTYDDTRGDTVVLVAPEKAPTPISHIDQVESWAHTESSVYIWASFAFVALGLTIDLGLKLLGPAPAQWA